MFYGNSPPIGLCNGIPPNLTKLDNVYVIDFTSTPKQLHVDDHILTARSLSLCPKMVTYMPQREAYQIILLTAGAF